MNNGKSQATSPRLTRREARIVSELLHEQARAHWREAYQVRHSMGFPPPIGLAWPHERQARELHAIAKSLDRQLRHGDAKVAARPSA